MQLVLLFLIKPVGKEIFLEVSSPLKKEFLNYQYKRGNIYSSVEWKIFHLSAHRCWKYKDMQEYKGYWDNIAHFSMHTTYKPQWKDYLFTQSRRFVQQQYLQASLC